MPLSLRHRGMLMTIAPTHFDFAEYIKDNFDPKPQQTDPNQVSINCINPDCDDNWRRNKKMTVNLVQRRAFCFKCGESYDVVGFVALAEGISRLAAVKIVMVQVLPRTYGANRLETALEKLAPTPAEEMAEKTAACKFPPLREILPGTLPAMYLEKRRIGQGIIDRFSLKFSPFGSYAGRIIIPIFKDGIPISFQGRTICGSIPKYLFPIDQPFDSELYNWDSARDCETLIIVEGVTSLWRVWEFGYPNVVASFGKSLKVQQEAAIKSATNIKNVIMLWDGGTLPEAYAAGKRLSASKKVFIAQLPGSLDPDECPDTPKYIEAAVPIGKINKISVALSKLAK